MTNQTKELTDAQLLLNVERLVKQEKHLTLAIINHLEEIHHRRLYFDLGYSSLHQYCTQHLKYSDSEAHNRICAMKITKMIPEAKEHIEQNKLTLTNATVLFGFIKNQEEHREKKISEEEKEDNPYDLAQPRIPNSTESVIVDRIH